MPTPSDTRKATRRARYRKLPDDPAWSETLACAIPGAGEKHDRGRVQRMLAAIVLGLSRGLPLHEDARFGIAAGAAALLGSGTKLCRRADVERLYNDGSC